MVQEQTGSLSIDIDTNVYSLFHLQKSNRAPQHPYTQALKAADTLIHTHGEHHTWYSITWYWLYANKSCNLLIDPPLRFVRLFLSFSVCLMNMDSMRVYGYVCRYELTLHKSTPYMSLYSYKFLAILICNPQHTHTHFFSDSLFLCLSHTSFPLLIFGFSFCAFVCSFCCIITECVSNMWIN